MTNEALASLLNMSRKGNLPQSVLLYGPSVTLVEQAARELLGGLFCSASAGARGCGQCADCRSMASGEHPEIFEIGGGVLHEAAKNESAKSETIKIDAVREAIDHLAWHSSVRADGRPSWRVVWLHQAENLTEQAANALLKTLEEPPEGAFLLLTSRHPRNLMPTLRSRLLSLRVAGREAASEVPAAVRETVRELLTARNVAASLAPAEKLARQGRMKPAEFAACAEMILNDIYREALAGDPAKTVGIEALVSMAGTRRRTLSQLHQLARRQRIALNTQFAAEMTGGLRIEP